MVSYGIVENCDNSLEYRALELSGISFVLVELLLPVYCNDIRDDFAPTILGRSRFLPLILYHNHCFSTSLLPSFS